MEKRIYFYLTFIFLVACFASCESRKVEPDPSRLGYDYFPLETGSYAIYDVHETYYALTANPITRIYQVKDEVTESFTDLAGETAFKVLRYSRKDPVASWQLDSVWTAKRTPSQAIRIENNVSFVKMVFPLEEQQSWNGNAQNILGEEKYFMQSIDKPYKLSTHEFNNTITVFHKADTLSIVGKDKRLEVYAKDVGMIYKEKVVVYYCQSSSDCLGKKKIDFGSESYYRLNSYGKN
ncbi:hypothetical protein GXP67_34550 [Rhodocytophaga rosea]|uniref:Uncharacterized protein n=1 Tax=Rhodocytophaga rosea TaxID=2704465 RepID=A0A6C0GU17_9BACT|nr:hypothetical protein [Rhodocytophaga rosea]QHT71417.1 hypothetical protein GXP67_34550 [Rhodocytophaga rosea]